MATLAAHGVATTLRTPTPAPKVDGRRERSAESRRRILAAMIALIDRGQVSPTAEQIAAHAEVSLRSVFRHFDDMGSLQLEIANEINKRVAPAIAAPFATLDWPGVLDAVIERRSALFEQVMPYKASMDIYRHRSHAVAAESRRLTAIQRDLLTRVFPAWVSADFDLFEALNALLSIETWQRLREQQNLSVPEAVRILRKMVFALVKGADPAP
ncbi:TetR/AcrR family transcriptional regulator [Sandaracinobacteroides saxicola]|uniref:TetR/AcrR family transcriptional regulator n=1 Tax=Sandaracinobacteroides saxicola TaxID=2759707 RepID=A0A7G5IHN2_9SPHN|nr:TetR/AcrR family transcriptional regulator [Sandaracinobacteroides saxicola]QMW22874.1 TetR/AcrR family transcriptional regulator [Sandaracinobacteroides saxicola]